MDRRTRDALNAINRRFYAAEARAFDAARDHPWPGWERVLPHLSAADPLRVLDVGCGNGRFAAFLLARAGRGLAYAGVDASAELLAIARARLSRPGATHAVDLVEADFVARPPGEVLPPGPYELVALFGVLHHVPGFEARRALLEACCARLVPGGLLALTLWRFGELPRFRRHVVPWKEYNRGAREPVDPAALERGDCLLRWGEHPDTLRYCHRLAPDELARLPRALPLAPVDDYTADGREDALNRYLLLRRAANA